VGCAVVPSCSGSYCATAGDTCCGLTESQCGASGGCQSGMQCLPLVDECASVLTKAGCTAAAFCK
jgi:hypothetical protein